ncbi:MAG: DUF4843 domain-containing protein [Chitinophagaceae bacterium]
MKNIFSLLIVSLIMLSSCIKQDHIIFTNELVEFDATVLNTPATGKNFPILTRVPVYGSPVSTSNPSITRTSGTIKFRVNLVGPQFSTDQTIAYSVVTSETTAVAGTHYTTPGTLVIPANSSFGELVVNVLNPGVSSSTPVILVLQLEGNDQIKPSENYKRLGISISQL